MVIMSPGNYKNNSFDKKCDNLIKGEDLILLVYRVIKESKVYTEKSRIPGKYISLSLFPMQNHCIDHVL